MAACLRGHSGIGDAAGENGAHTNHDARDERPVTLALTANRRNNLNARLRGATRGV
jgi:hypothetical protein